MLSRTKNGVCFAMALVTAVAVSLPARGPAAVGLSGVLGASGLAATGLVLGVEPEATPSEPQPTLGVTAQLYISYAGNGNYLVVIDGHSTAVNASVGVRVYGDDPWFDDFLFSIVGYARTDLFGNFNVSKTVPRSVLNEDWEGQDEIYANVEVAGGGSTRTNTISRSF